MGLRKVWALLGLARSSDINQFVDLTLNLNSTPSFYEVGRGAKYFKAVSDVSYTFEKTEDGNRVTEQAPLRRVGTVSGPTRFNCSTCAFILIYV